MRGTPLTWRAHRITCREAGVTPASAAGSPSTIATGRSGVGDHDLRARERPQLAERLPRPRQAQPELALDALGVEGHERHARLGDGDGERVVEQVLAAEPAVAQALQRDRLHRGALAVGVDADLAREHAVGPGHRVLAHVDHLRARVTVREPAQALLQLAWRAPGTGLERGVDEPQPGELRRQLPLHPALAQLEVELGRHREIRSALARSSSSVRLPSSTSATVPPARVKTVVGQPPTP